MVPTWNRNSETANSLKDWGTGPAHRACAEKLKLANGEATEVGKIVTNIDVDRWMSSTP